MPIKKSAFEKTGYLLAQRKESLLRVVARLAAAKGEGKSAWYLVVAWGKGQFRLIKFAELADQINHSRFTADPESPVISEFELYPVPIVDVAATTTREARLLAKWSPGGAVIVTESGSPVGVVAAALPVGKKVLDIFEAVKRVIGDSQPGAGDPLKSIRDIFLTFPNNSFEEEAGGEPKAANGGGLHDLGHQIWDPWVKSQDDEMEMATPPAMWEDEEMEMAEPEEANGGGSSPKSGQVKEEDGPDSERFEAHPALIAPHKVTPEEYFPVVIGFRETADPTLSSQKKIDVVIPSPDASFMVMLVAEGADIIGDASPKPLPFNKSAKIAFVCKPRPGVDGVTLTVQYLLNWQMVGMAQREVQVGVVTAHEERIPAPDKEIAGCSIGAVAPDSQPDLEVTLTRGRQNDEFTWTIKSHHLQKAYQARSTIEDAREFAAKLIGKMEILKHRGRLAARELANNGQDIAEIMPEIFFEVLREIYTKTKSTPTLLFITDETYIPWELAWVDPPLDERLPKFLGTQTVMGRWFSHQDIAHPPPAEVDLHEFSIVASEYGRGSGQGALPYALKEQEDIQKIIGGTGALIRSLRAEEAAIISILPPDHPNRAGHLVHFATHGESDVASNDQSIPLEDKTVITSGALAGTHRCGETPTFSFVFLNACLVGSGGTSLGQAAGFPGDLIRGGSLGFLAPLWKVNDKIARGLAEAFYQETIISGQGVADFVRSRRLNYDGESHNTPMAYIYYGHPNLRLRVPPLEVKNDEP